MLIEPRIQVNPVVNAPSAELHERQIELREQRDPNGQIRCCLLRVQAARSGQGQRSGLRGECGLHRRRRDVLRQRLAPVRVIVRGAGVLHSIHVRDLSLWRLRRILESEPAMR
jgi:hypothetical protein